MPSVHWTSQQLVAMTTSDALRSSTGNFGYVVVYACSTVCANSGQIFDPRMIN